MNVNVKQTSIHKANLLIRRHEEFSSSPVWKNTWEQGIPEMQESASAGEEGLFVMGGIGFSLSLSFPVPL